MDRRKFLKLSKGGTLATLTLGGLSGILKAQDEVTTNLTYYSQPLPDDCVELQTLRAFRDGYMQQRVTGRELIEEYYEMGPSVVKKINGHPKREELYNYIYDTLINDSVDLISKGEHQTAMEYYSQYVIGLNRLLTWGGKIS